MPLSRTPRLLEAGATFDDRYRVARAIAVSGVDAVYEAFTSDGERVALRVLHQDVVTTPRETADRLFREGALRLGLRHPTSLHVLDWGRDAHGAFFAALQWSSARSLAAFVAARGPLEPAKAITVAARVCAALREAHAAGFSHGAVDASVVRVAEYDPAEVRLGGFDAPLVRAALGWSHDASMAFSYGAPEVEKGADPTTAADVFGVGSLLLTALAEREVTPASRMQVSDTAVRRLLGRGVPPQLVHVIRMCTAPRHADRIDSMDTLLRALAACQQACSRSRSSELAQIG